MSNTKLINILNKFQVDSFCMSNGTVNDSTFNDSTFSYISNTIGSKQMYEIMSVAKVILGIACGILYDSGKLDINAKISKWFPEYKNITIKDLLMHKSGIDATWNPRGDLFKSSRGRTTGEKIYQYNNYNAILLITIINSIENAEKLYRKIFKLLGITKFKIVLQHGIPLGAYGIWLSAADLCKIGSAFSPGSKILSKKWITMAKKNKFMLMNYGGDLYGHDGSYGQYLVFNDKVTFAICKKPVKDYYTLINKKYKINPKFDIEPKIKLIAKLLL